MINKNFMKKSSILILLLIIGFVLLGLSGSFSSTQEKTESTEKPTEFELCETRCEKRIALLVEEIYGIQEASVLVTLDELPSTKERPRVRGVAIVCRGEETPELRLKVVMLISSALGISSDKIYVTFN